MARKVFTLFLVAGTIMVTACNTVEGAGRDAESVGQAVENTVN